MSGNGTSLPYAMAQLTAVLKPKADVELIGRVCGDGFGQSSVARGDRGPGVLLKVSRFPSAVGRASIASWPSRMMSP